MNSLNRDGAKETTPVKESFPEVRACDNYTPINEIQVFTDEQTKEINFIKLPQASEKISFDYTPSKANKWEDLISDLLNRKATPADLINAIDKDIISAEEKAREEAIDWMRSRFMLHDQKMRNNKMLFGIYDFEENNFQEIFGGDTTVLKEYIKQDKPLGLSLPVQAISAISNKK